jgi:hypothetical protein
MSILASIREFASDAMNKFASMFQSESEIDTYEPSMIFDAPVQMTRNEAIVKAHSTLTTIEEEANNENTNESQSMSPPEYEANERYILMISVDFKINKRYF